MSNKPKGRVLISVADKTGLVPFCKTLHQMGFELIGTSGTVKELAADQIPVMEVSSYTGFPEILSGRVKTLHPKIHAGLLARTGLDEDTLEKHELFFIDMVVVNLYPFQQTIENPECTLENAIENIDIGGSTLIRSAAKNHERVTVVIDPKDYQTILTELAANGDTFRATRLSLAQKAFSYSAFYDSTIAQYLNQKRAESDASTLISFPEYLTLSYRKKALLRYGENPHQEAAWYGQIPPRYGSLAENEQLQGKELSFNNLLDSNAAWCCAKSLDAHFPTCVIVKHTVPCGVAQGDTLYEAYIRAYQSDPLSAFGGIVAFNQSLDAKTAAAIIELQFVEVIIVPHIELAALSILEKKPQIRLLVIDQEEFTPFPPLQIRSISGGILLQQMDTDHLIPDHLVWVTERRSSLKVMRDLIFAWKVAMHAKSNAIVFAKDLMTLGIGSGQTSRVFSAKMAIEKAQEANLNLSGSVLASDAFIPFPDTVELASKMQVEAIIQPGGSKQDAAVIEAANKAGIAMAFTGLRHFLH